MKSLFNRILVPIDGSDASRVAQVMAVFIAKSFHSEVTVMHVVSHEYMTPGSTVFSREGEAHSDEYATISTATGQFPRTVKLPPVRQNELPTEVVTEITQWYTEKGREAISAAVLLFKTEDISVKEKLVEGADAAQSILQESIDGNHDLLVVANSGEVQDSHLGSTARKVTAGSRIPVLIVRGRGAIAKVLISLAGSSHDDKALSYASRLVQKTGSKVILLHVQEKTLLKLRPELETIGKQILNQAATQFKDSEIKQTLIPGDPAKQIIETAEREMVDLIVMSGGRLGTVRKYLLGSVTDHVIQHATLPVLVVK